MKTTRARRPGCFPTVLNRGKDRVIERRSAPWRQPIHRLQPHRRIGGATRQREDVVVKGEQADLVGRTQCAKETFHRGFQRRHRVRHAFADVDGDDQLERDVLAGECGQLLDHTVFADAELVTRQTLHEGPRGIGDGGRHLDDLDVDGLGVARVLRSRRGRDAAARSPALP